MFLCDWAKIKKSTSIFYKKSIDKIITSSAKKHFYFILISFIFAPISSYFQSIRRKVTTGILPSTRNMFFVETRCFIWSKFLCIFFHYSLLSSHFRYWHFTFLWGESFKTNSTIVWNSGSTTSARFLYRLCVCACAVPACVCVVVYNYLRDSESAVVFLNPALFHSTIVPARLIDCFIDWSINWLIDWLVIAIVEKTVLFEYLFTLRCSSLISIKCLIAKPSLKTLTWARRCNRMLSIAQLKPSRSTTSKR